LARLNFIKRAQHLGMSLAEIREFLDVHDQGDLPCEQVQQKLRDKLVDIDRQIQQLQLLKQEVEGLLSDQAIQLENPANTICPIIEQLE